MGDEKRTLGRVPSARTGKVIRSVYLAEDPARAVADR